MSREDLDKQFELQYKDKTPDEMIEIGRQMALQSMQKEKDDAIARVRGLKSFFNLTNPSTSSRFKK